MGKLRPSSSNTNLKPAPSWDAEPTSPAPAAMTIYRPPPDSPPADPLQTRNASSDYHEKTSTSPPPSPRSTSPPPLLTSHVNPEPSALSSHNLDDIKSVQRWFSCQCPWRRRKPSRTTRLYLTCLLKITATNNTRSKMGLLLQLPGHMERHEPMSTATRPPEDRRSCFCSRRRIIRGRCMGEQAIGFSASKQCRAGCGGIGGHVDRAAARRATGDSGSVRWSSVEEWAP